MAIAIGAGLSPERGLYAAIVGGFLISLLGGSRFQIGGPAAAFIGLVAMTVQRHGYDGLMLATLMAGGLLLVIGFLRLGTYIKYIPYPVTVGFTAGIAVIILVSQARDLFGLQLASDPADTVPKLKALWGAIGTVSPVTVALSVFSIAAILLIRRVRPNWPALLIAVAGATLLTALLGLNVETIGSRFGTIPSGMPVPQSRPSASKRSARSCPMRSRSPFSARSNRCSPPWSPTACRDGAIDPTANWWRRASAISPRR